MLHSIWVVKDSGQVLCVHFAKREKLNAIKENLAQLA